MQESESIVANRTHGSSNHPCESSEGNALEGASPGRAGGLASYRAATSRNHCSAVMATTRTRFKWRTGVPSLSKRGEGSTRKQVSDACACGDPRRKGGSTVARTGMQSGEVPCSVEQPPECEMPTMVVGYGTSHEAIVAMMVGITTRTSEGPLGVRGHDMHGVPGLLPLRATRPLEKPSHAYMAKPAANLSVVVQAGKAAGDGSARRLEPDWGNLAVRHLRGAEGNLTIGREG